MNIHAEHTPENKSQSVANKLAQKRGISNSTLRFMDNRLSVTAQRKLREMANNSTQQKQLSAFQEMANNRPATLQLKKLQGGKLNVVGEHHAESNGRRELERELAAEKVGGEYWTEDEFRIRERKVTEIFEQGSEEDPRAFGDVLYLRIAESIQYVDEAKNDFKKYWKAWVTKDKGDEDLAGIKGELQKILVICKTHLNGAKGLIASLKNNEERVSLNDGQTIFVSKIDEMLAPALELFLGLAEIWKKNTLSLLIKIDFPGYFEEFSKDVDAMTIPAAALGGKKREATSKLRSYAMDAGAGKGKDIVGVWKIGYDHVKDIKGKMEEGETKDYNLIDRSEFNNEYKQLPVLVDDKMVPQEGF